mmetsp:Transcript_82903/g.164498  ORF Transcript_82903/g.164498 Transcript_82903/m.164498 type:complete len:232 (-) Transcript_82903:229-924(-)
MGSTLKCFLQQFLAEACRITKILTQDPVLQHDPPFFLIDFFVTRLVHLIKNCLQASVSHFAVSQRLLFGILLISFCRGADHVVTHHRGQNCQHCPVAENHETSKEQLSIHCVRHGRNDCSVTIHELEQREQGIRNCAEVSVRFIIQLDVKGCVGFIPICGWGQHVLPDQACPHNCPSIQRYECEHHNPLHGLQRLHHPKQQVVERLDCPQEPHQSQYPQQSEHPKQVQDAL